jgi:ABC-type transport system involved in multi-copper enzyme maturation permease subunit
MRWGPGPVFIYECLTSSRRWQTFAIRSFSVTALLIAMTTIAWSSNAMLEGESWREYARLGEGYFYALIGVELALVMFAAPAAAAGAICLDRSRGTLAHILATDLSDQEIVLGKLAARLLPFLGLVACSWPVLSITSLLGGIDPLALTIALAVIVAVTILGCTMSLALSVWARKPHEVVLVIYAIWIVDLLIWPAWFSLSNHRMTTAASRWVPVTNPFYVALARYAQPGRADFWSYLGFFATALAASGIFTVAAVGRMRPVACRAEESAQPRLGRLGRMIRRLPGPSLDRNPVLWREWHRSRPSPWMMRLLVLGGGTTSVACVVGAVAAWLNGVDPTSSNPAVSAGVYGYMLQLLFGLLMLSAVAPISLSEERQRGSLDVLAATTLTTQTIVLGKWWGTFRLVPLLAIGPGLMGLGLAISRKIRPPRPPGFVFNTGEQLSLGYRLFGAALLVATILAHGAMLTSIGLALAAWIKRQSRAISISVGLFIVLAVGWPALVVVTLRSNADARGPATLSPIFCAAFFADLLTIRLDAFRASLWWTVFWIAEVTFWAVALLWLTIRRFDRFFERVSEQAQRTFLLPDLGVLWAGTTAIAGAAGALLIWHHGIAAGVSPRSSEAAKMAGYLGVVILDLFVLAIVAPISLSDECRRGTVDDLVARPRSAQTIVLAHWWRTFRLVALLAIGPGMVVLALATGREIPPATTPATVPNASEMGLAVRLVQAGLFILTILAHGAALASAGVLLSVWIKRTSRAIILSCCLFVLTALAWPMLDILIVRLGSSMTLSVISPVEVAWVLLSNLMVRVDQLPQAVWWATLYDIAVGLLAPGFLAMAVKTFDRRFAAKALGPTRTAGKPEPPAADPFFASE